MFGGVGEAVSLVLYGGIALLALGFWVWVIGSYAAGWTSPAEVVERSEK